MGQVGWPDTCGELSPPRAVFQTCPMPRIFWDHGFSFRIQAPLRTRLSPGGWEDPWERAFWGLSSSSGLGSSALGEEEDSELCSSPGDSLGIGLGTGGFKIEISR